MTNEDRCKDCTPATLCGVLRDDLNRIEDMVNDLTARVGKVETKQEVNEEQTKMVFKILKEIKDSVGRIADKIDTIEKKPATRWEQLVTTVITVAVSAIATYIITKR